MIVVGAACASITMAASDKCGASFQQKSNIAQCGNNFYFTNKLEFDAEFVFFSSNIINIFNRRVTPGNSVF